MMEGTVRHGATMAIEGSYVDSHGQSEIGFGVTRLLGFDLAGMLGASRSGWVVPRAPSSMRPTRSLRLPIITSAQVMTM
jgi:hypothetical protein